MELTKKLNYVSFDPTPKLKSSPVPILFVSFNMNDLNCIHCGDEYVKTVCEQYYCKKCLLYYLANITDNNLYLDIYVLTENLECGEHEISMTKEPQNIQKCCKNCLGIFCFKQISNYGTYFSSDSFENMIESEKNCRLCGKSLYQEIDTCSYCNIRLCSDCYSISSECVELTLTKKPITIFYLPTGNSDLDDFLDNSRLEIHNQLKLAEFTDKIKNIGNYFIPNSLFISIYYHVVIAEILMEWIPYSQFTNVKEIARGGFGIIYLATWLDGSIKVSYDRERSSNETVILKRFKNSQDISRYFLNELKSNQYCYKMDHHIIKTYGFTRDPKFDDYILVMQFASGGDLHNWIQQNFSKITWNKEKLAILWQISEGCWDPDPEKRPSITKVRITLGKWYLTNKNIAPFNQAETKRKELISLKKLGPDNSSKEYISRELEFDLDFSNRSDTLGTKRKIEEININSHGNNGKSIKISSSHLRTSFTDE
ncbi:kinase-like domain-containing protein [Rhizophagus irregularis DAOM 181602=DAOM 197198]|nr:kinase-like domain-containing protein [Rhizophagus irregularis DAOM 181602=DAOM 197198]